jgi:hypothetical protein
MLDDMDFYVADITDNESLKQSIKMVREILYSRAEENIMIDEEEKKFRIKEKMAEQRGMTKE